MKRASAGWIAMPLLLMVAIMSAQLKEYGANQMQTLKWQSVIHSTSTPNALVRHWLAHPEWAQPSSCPSLCIPHQSEFQTVSYNGDSWLIHYRKSIDTNGNIRLRLCVMQNQTLAYCVWQNGSLGYGVIALAP